jgi:hypothetical protein
MKELRDQRSDSTAGHDDRPFSAKRSARSDGNRCRHRLQYGHARLDPAAIDQDRFNGFRNAVPANAFGAVAGHETDDQRADNRDDENPWSQRGVRWGHCRNAEALKEEDVGEQADEQEQRARDVGGHHTDGDGHHAQQDHARCGGEVAEPLGGAGNVMHA